MRKQDKWYLGPAGKEIEQQSESAEFHRWNIPLNAQNVRLIFNSTQRPRIDLDKRFLPRPNTTIALKLIPHRFKINKN